jgi:uncharacterized protein GlcG (DUF336 family)
MPLPLESATRILAAARLEAHRLGVASISVVVLDADGVVRLAAREDSQGSFGIDIATAKAATALGFGRSSQDVAAMFSEPRVASGLAAALGERFLPLAGAVPIAGPHGVVGAVGVAGGLPDIDHTIAAAGAAAAGLNDHEGG